MKPTFYCAHGWGYDASFWNPLRHAFPEAHYHFYEAGYYGAPSHNILPTTPFWALGHSAGTQHILERSLPHCLGIITFNSFLCFSARPDYPYGIAQRILQRMIHRLETSPKAVLSSFLKMCGDTPHIPSIPNIPALKNGLEQLIHTDLRTHISHNTLPILSIYDKNDPLSPAQRPLTYQHSHSLLSGGHLLPKTHPYECMHLIKDFIDNQ